MSRIAIMIIAHRNESQLRLLLDNLRDDFDLFVHIDTQSAISKTALEKDFPQVKFFSQYHVVWGGFTLSACSLFLFQQAHKYNYDYYILISGQDLPIKSNKTIKAFVEENDTSLVLSEKLPLPQWKYNGGLDRVGLYWESDITGNSLWDKFRRRLIGNIRKNQRIYNKRRPFYKGMDIYGGSNWFLLKNDAMNYLLSFVDNNPGFIKRLKHCFCTDELWVQTILATCDCKIKNEHFTYIHWYNDSMPKELTIGDYDAIINSPYLFARKFDIEADSDIIFKVLEHRNSI